MDNYTNLLAVTMMTKALKRDPELSHASVYAKHTAHAQIHIRPEMTTGIG